MPFRSQVYTNRYSSLDWDIMANAYQLAFQQIGDHPRVQRDRLARSIMTFFDLGVRCVSTLSSLAMSREMSLIDVERMSGPIAEVDIVASDEMIYHQGRAQ
jgi:hypothetical protein